MRYEERVRELEAEGLTRSDAQAVVDAEEMNKVRLTDAIKHEVQYARPDITHFDWDAATQHGEQWTVPVITFFSDEDGFGFEAWMTGNMIIEFVNDELDYSVGDWQKTEEANIPAELYQ